MSGSERPADSVSALAARRAAVPLAGGGPRIHHAVEASKRKQASNEARRHTGSFGGIAACSGLVRRKAEVEESGLAPGIRRQVDEMPPAQQSARESVLNSLDTT